MYGWEIWKLSPIFNQNNIKTSQKTNKKKLHFTECADITFCSKIIPDSKYVLCLLVFPIWTILQQSSPLILQSEVQSMVHFISVNCSTLKYTFRSPLQSTDWVHGSLMSTPVQYTVQFTMHSRQWFHGVFQRMVNFCIWSTPACVHSSQFSISFYGALQWCGLLHPLSMVCDPLQLMVQYTVHTCPMQSTEISIHITQSMLQKNCSIDSTYKHFQCIYKHH